MQTTDIVNLFDRFPLIKSHFKGVFPVDLIPSKLPQKFFIIFNKDPSTLSGSHWICLLRFDLNNYEIFDSLGTDLNYLKQYLHFPDANYFYNTQPFQDHESSTCGLFASFFAIHRLMNLDLDYHEVLSEIFQINPKSNEKKVLEFFAYFIT